MYYNQIIYLLWVKSTFLEKPTVFRYTMKDVSCKPILPLRKKCQLRKSVMIVINLIFQWIIFENLEIILIKIQNLAVTCIKIYVIMK
jgi:hypothetical protein